MWIIKNQKGRRNLTPAQIAALIVDDDKLVAIATAEAKARMEAGKQLDPNGHAQQGSVAEVWRNNQVEKPAPPTSTPR